MVRLQLAVKSPPRSLCHDSDLLEESEIVLKMPIVGDAAVPDAQDVRRDEVNRLAISLVPHEAPGEMAREAEMRDDAIADHQPLHHRHVQVGHCIEEALACLRRPSRSLRAALRQRVVDEVGPDRAGE